MLRLTLLGLLRNEHTDSLEEGEGNIVITPGSNGTASVSSDVANEGLDREQTVVFRTTNSGAQASVSTTISQIGKRQAFAVAEGRFLLSDGSTFNVIKRVFMSDYNSGFTGDRVVELLNMIPNLAKADLSNAMTVSLGQNGYAKFNNGLLIQWGYKTGSSNGTNTTYTSISFYNAAYVPVITYYEPGNGMNIIIGIIINKQTSYFTIRSRYAVGDSNGTGAGTNDFYWIAVGRWK